MACTGEQEVTNANVRPTEKSPEIAGSGTPEDPNSSATPSPLTELPTMSIAAEGLCEGVEGTKLPGAERYIQIDLQIRNSQVTGTETLLRFSNTSWTAAGGADCRMLWSLRGEIIPAHGCSSCSTGVAIRAVADSAANTCPKAMFEEDGADFETSYDLNLRADGTASIHFSRNGKRWAEGYHLNSRLVASSDHSCEWF